eukprot:jgi/Tetstr1/465000/TSEL_009731.t1
MREAWGRLQAVTPGHLSDADARVMEREEEVASGSEKELAAFRDHANNSRLPNESLKSTLMEFKTIRYGVKYTVVPPRATAVDRFKHFLLGDIHRGLAVRDAARHSTEPRKKGPLRAILDMSENTGMVFGTLLG